MRIAFADDDEDLRRGMVQVFEAAEFKYDLFSNGRDIITALGRESYDLVMVDWVMPHRTGIDVVQWAKDNLDPAPPAIVLTSKSASHEIVNALEAGADDVIVKPEVPEVIIARIRSAVRRTVPAPQDPEEQRYGRYRIVRSAQKILLDGNEIELTRKEFLLAAMLFQNCGKALSRGHLMHRIWGTAENVASRTLDMHLSKIRAKLALRAENGFMIHTISRFGYRLEQVGGAA